MVTKTLDNQKPLQNTDQDQSSPRAYQKKTGFRRNQNRGNEPFEVMLRRFFRDVQQSGILTETKKRRFREKELSRKILRESARRKAQRRKIKRGY